MKLFDIQEVEHRLRKMGYSEEDLRCPRPLTAKIYREACPEFQSLWEVKNSRELDKALDAELAEKQNQTRTAKIDANDALYDCYEGEMSAEDQKKYHGQQEQWLRVHPQWIPSLDNLKILVTELKQRKLLPTADNMNEVFRVLVLDGKISVSPKAAGIGPEEEISGVQLQTYAGLYRLTEPIHTKPDASAAQSADEFWAATPEIQDHRVSPLLFSKMQQLFETFLTFNPSFPRSESSKQLIMDALEIGKYPVTLQGVQECYDALLKRGVLRKNIEAEASSGATKVFNLGGRTPGYPQLEGSSVRKTTGLQEQVAQMDSATYKLRLTNDPKFRRIVDGEEEE